MNATRFATIERVCQAALDEPPERRAAFLEEACAGDAELRAEVESLLDGTSRADSFLESSATRLATASHPPGEQVGPYRIVSLLGAGGMGEVYRAHDTHLGRDVAIKTLPPHFARDPERLARLRREARALASLNHPNIGAIYGLEHSGGVDYLVLELVEGETLRGPLPLSTALDRARQVAKALEVAHEHGIVHRDLKPANIKVTPQGAVKVLDFGLAKALRPSDIGLAAASVTETGTATGQVMGTPGYMSPEQARGAAVDERTDIWAFGCVLYELLTGRGAFQRETTSDTIAALLEHDPDWRAIPATTPVKVRDLLRRCLEKDPNRRLTRIAEARAILDQAIHPGPVDVRAALAQWIRRPMVWGSALVLLLALVASGAWFVKYRERVNWVKTVALPQLVQLVEASGFGGRPETIAAFRLAQELENDLGGNAAFARLQARVTGETSIDTNPAGATVYARPYEELDAPWELVGTTPISRYRGPLTLVRFKVEKPGYQTVFRSMIPSGFDLKTRRVVPGSLRWELDKAGTIPPGMVWIDATGDLPRFLMDQHEVTNREFKAFVDAGGYGDARFWTVPFEDDGKTLARAEAMKRLVDRTRRPGPSTWEAGDFPDGQAEFPVTGVSWYEAAAYAVFANKELPTVAHWQAAASGGSPRGSIGADLVWALATRMLISLSNFSDKGPVKVASRPATTLFEVFDMAGNAREWCWNRRGEGRAIQGGAWNDHNYMFRAPTQAVPFDRAPRNGFRCMRLPDRTKVPRTAFDPAPVAPAVRDYSRERPVPDAVFAAYRQQYSYDAIPLDARVEARVARPGWTRERVSFAAAYGGERMILQLFLPANGRAPFQTVVYFPGAAAQTAEKSDEIERGVDFLNNLSFHLKSGRAVAYPVYKGTLERRLMAVPPCGDTHEFAAFQRALVQDARRTLDYLETRPDIDKSRFAYTGWSWGGRLAGLVLAVEPRFKAAVFGAAGLGSRCRKLPEADEFNFVPHITTPVLMLQGRYDLGAPLETDAKPFFDLLGTRPADKALKLYDTDHFIPRREMIQESLAWLDKYLGPVKR